MTKTRKRYQKVIAIALCIVTILSIMSISVSAASVSSSLGYNEAESSGDWVYWDGRKVVKSSSTSKDEIKWIQAALNYCRVKAGLRSNRLVVDGSFGPASKEATIVFQKAYGLKADGKFGPDTIKKMKSILNEGRYDFFADAAVNRLDRTSNSSQATNTYTTFDQQNIIQYNTSKKGDFITGSWAKYKKNGKYDDTISSSGCGIVALVSAVYNLGGTIEKNEIDGAIKNVFDWAYGKHWCDGTNWTLYAASDEKFGDKYGFNILETNNTYGCYGGYGKANTDLSPLVSHLKDNKGTAVVHVYGHYMAAVDYRVENGKEQILIFDPGPGDMGSTKRGGLTKAAGSWIDLSVLKNGSNASKLSWSSSSNKENIEIDGYWLVSKK